MNHWLATYIMRGRVQAMMVASTLALLSLIIPPINVFSSASVALVTLRRGGYEGLIILACSVLVSALLGYLVVGNFQFTLVYSLVLWLPVWLISIVLREGRHLSLAIEIAVLLGIIGVLCFYGYQTEVAAFWKTMLSAMLASDAPIEAHQMIDKMSPYMTGIVAAGSVGSLLFGLFLGRWWQAMLYNVGGFKREYLSLQSQTSVALISASIVVFALGTTGLAAEVSANVSILIMLLYTFIGTATLHSYFTSVKHARYVIYMFYITLFLIPHAIILVALVGLTDPWLNLRKTVSLDKKDD